MVGSMLSVCGSNLITGVKVFDVEQSFGLISVLNLCFYLY